MSDGDFVIVKKQNHCQDGEIVVVLVDGQTALKRYYQESGGVRLESAHAKPISAQKVDVLGVVVGVIRRC